MKRLKYLKTLVTKAFKTVWRGFKAAKQLGYLRKEVSRLVRTNSVMLSECETSQYRCNSKIMRFFGLCPQNDKSYSRVAFTLAEVLITLGVIGVVAILVMPTIMSNYEKKVTEIRLLKVYTQFSDVIRKSELDNGPIKYWDFGDGYSSTNKFMNTYILPYFDNSKYCGKIIWGSEGLNVAQCGFECNGWRLPNGECSGESGYQTYRLDDYPVATNVSVSYCTSNQNVTCSPRIQFVTFFIDVNGRKGKGIMGKDIFEFTLFNYKYDSNFQPGNGEHYGFKVGGICGNHGCYNQPIENLLNGGGSVGQAACGNMNTNIHAGKACGVLIQKNGWKIPDNYPIKF